jgi:hypothetical protein
MKPGGSWIGKTFRLPFPTDREFDARVQRLVDNTRKILTERGEKSFIRIGFSAVDFVVRPKTGIDSFFVPQQQQQQNATPSKRRGGEGSVDGTSPMHAKKPDANFSMDTRARLNARLKQDKQKEESGLQSWFAKVDNAKGVVVETTSPHRNTNLNQSSGNNNKSEILTVEEGRDTTATATATATEEEANRKMLSDEELARRLQSAYDDEARENNNINNSNNIQCVEATDNDVVGRDRAIALQLQSSIVGTINDDMDRDRAIALQLQSTYDREHSILSDVERFSGISKRKKGASPKNHNKRNRIDNFFSKR